MKTVFNLILVVVCLTVFSCKKDEVTQTVSNPSSITTNGVLSGVIINDSTFFIDSVIVEDEYENIVSSTAPSKGAFSISLKIPHLSKYGKAPAGVTCSDTSAMTGRIYLYTYDQYQRRGSIIKSNFNQEIDYNMRSGKSESSFVYSDRTFTENGSHTDTYISGPNKVKITTITNYSNVKRNKGWTELVETIDSYVQTSESITAVITISNVISSDLKWRYSRN